MNAAVSSPTRPTIAGLAVGGVLIAAIAVSGAGVGTAATIDPATSACAAVVPDAAAELTVVEPVASEWPPFEFVGPTGDFVAAFPAIPAHRVGELPTEGGEPFTYDEWLYDEPAIGYSITRIAAPSSLEAALIEAVVARGLALPTACVAVDIAGVDTGDVTGLEFEGVGEGFHYRGRVFATADATFEVLMVGDTALDGEFVASVRPAADVTVPADISAVDLSGLFRPVEGDFAVAFPAEPSLVETTAPSADGTMVPTALYLLDDREPAMVVGRVTLAFESPTYDFDLGFEGMLSGAGVTDYELHTSENFLLQGHRARRVETYVAIGSARGSLVALQVFSADRGLLYQAMVLGSGQFDMSDPDVAAFVDSFVLTEPEGTV